MEKFLTGVVGERSAKIYTTELIDIGAESVDDLQYLLPDDYTKIGVKLIHMRKILKAISNTGKGKSQTLESKDNPKETEEKIGFSAKNEKTLEKHKKALSIFFS